ncbi:regulatory LuxR family protein [Winogradskyella wandonensis]|uniref:Regulatory LuxR family protein n=1 Tax=Winogradskyella wandonensis TaxID=1442586 RepID=A0A4V2PT63_9FLAO|nr:LuxR C-terminal-related transcriptional regulator [Winogradskyella wandonensis]TCK65261.1 regulatory LuxR family protein [Winogradskyella wandonensis]
MRIRLVILLLFVYFVCEAQYSFSGYIDAEEWQSTVYLSLVEDYRKIDGVYSEQIIAKTIANADGYFKFTGNMLDEANRIYRIHVDKCSENLQDSNHFNGHCSDSKALIFIANNNDNLELPFSFDNEVFCNIISTNPKANAFVKIDSLKQDMKFAYGEFRSETNRKLNNRKWFKTLQNFGKSLNEPLAELYIYAYLSDRTSDLHNYYVEDLSKNNYYDDLKTKLLLAYPESTYTKQYTNELASDKFMISTSDKTNSSMYWQYLLYGILGLSLVGNIYFILQKRNAKKQSKQRLKDKLSKQERVVLDLLLQDKTNKDIAETLFLSVSTVKTHTNNIYKKLNVQSREDAKSLFFS